MQSKFYQHQPQEARRPQRDNPRVRSDRPRTISSNETYNQLEFLNAGLVDWILPQTEEGGIAGFHQDRSRLVSGNFDSETTDSFAQNTVRGLTGQEKAQESAYRAQNILEENFDSCADPLKSLSDPKPIPVLRLTDTEPGSYSGGPIAAACSSVSSVSFVPEDGTASEVGGTRLSEPLPSNEDTQASQGPLAKDMRSSSQAWPRSDDGRSSMQSASPQEVKADSVEEDPRQIFTPSDPNGPKTSILRARQVDAFNDSRAGLPAEKGFPIQIGSEFFRLSGASIMSDAPSYFTKFFEEQLRTSDDGAGSVKTLYIDRDPATFQDIALHLQGYHIVPHDGYHYVKLFADAQFYGLPKLIKQLFESEYFIRIGEKDFRIAKDIFSSPGNTPNFFTLGFTILNAPSTGEIFPGLPQENLFRPPSIEAPALLNRSSDTFSDILHLLRGYPLKIRSQEHRNELLRDCRYYHLRGLEQQLIQHSISFNAERQKSEVVIRLEDIRQSGVSFVGDVTPSDRSPLAGWVNYARPFVDETSYELVLEMGDESCRLYLRQMRAEFFGKAKARITSLFQVVANKMNLPTNAPLGLMMSSGGVDAQPVSPGNTPLSDDLVKASIERDTHVVLDGEEFNTAELLEFRSIRADEQDPSGLSSNTPRSGEEGGGGGGGGGSSSTGGHLHPMRRSGSPSVQQPPRKRPRRGSLDEFGEWIIQKAQWRLRVQPRPDQEVVNGNGMEIIMMAVKLESVSGQKGRNAKRGFLA